MSVSGLCLVTDRDLCHGRSLVEVVERCIDGGVTLVQVREKHASTREFIEEAIALLRILRPRNIPLIVNDRVDVALAVGADGVHLGQQDMPYQTARRLLGPGAIIGLSVETESQVLEAEALDVDYLGISPVFDTPTKQDTRGSWGLEGISRVRVLSRHTLVAIGGLNETNAASAIAAGADSVAVVSALCAAPDPCTAARQLNKEIRRTSAGRQTNPEEIT